LVLQIKRIYEYNTSVRIALLPNVMTIVAKGGAVFEFYMEQSSVDFVYISSLKNNHSPQWSGLNLCSCYSKQNCTWPSNDPPSLQGI